jgi:DNA-binding response OmpR family regulator
MKKILIIEDDQIVANIYRNKFAVEGYQVEIALDGQKGLETLRSFRPDALILDLMLPKLSGVDLIKCVRAEADFQQMPIVVFSNTYLTNMVQEAWKAGATKCLSKANCSPKQVIEIVSGTLGNGTAKGVAGGHGTAKPPPPPTLPPPAPTGGAQSDAEFQAELRRSFLESLPTTLAGLRTILKALVKSDTEVARIKQVHEMYRTIHALTGNAGVAGTLQITQMSDALEALLKELYEKPKNITASTLRTVASAVDFLAVLFDRGQISDAPEALPANILVVDDEPISRRAITYALEKAKLKSVTVEDPQVAYKLLSENPFDLVFLDVDMPNMNGYELCTKLRALPAHKKTPVVFVTGLTDFESRASSMMSGGNDFIAKPFLFIELAVKALVYMLRARIGSQMQNTDAEVSGAPAMASQGP